MTLKLLLNSILVHFYVPTINKIDFTNAHHISFKYCLRLGRLRKYHVSTRTELYLAFVIRPMMLKVSLDKYNRLLPRV